MRMREIAVLAVVAVVAVLVLVVVALQSCGDDEFKAKAEKACKQGRSQLEKVEKNASSKPAAQLSGSQAVVKRARSKLAGLQPPADEKADYERYLAALDLLIALEPKVAAAIENGDVGEAKRLAAQVRRSDRAAKQAAADAGLPECAS